MATRLPFGLPAHRRRHANSAPREPWKATTRHSVDLSDAILPSLAKQAAGIGAWVPKPQKASKERSRNEDSLPQIEEIANRIADRYAGGLTKLTQVQKEWRQKHDALVRRRQQAGYDDLNSPGREDTHSSSLRDGSHSVRKVPSELALPERAHSHRSARSSGNTPRRGPKKKKKRIEIADEVEVTEPEEDKEPSINDILKSGFSDLFHAKRDDIAQAKPKAEDDDYDFPLPSRGVGEPWKSSFEELQLVSPVSDTQASSAEEVLDENQDDPRQIIGDEADLAVLAAVDSAMVDAAGEDPPVQHAGTRDTAASELEEEDGPETVRFNSKRSVPYRPEAAVRLQRSSSNRAANWMRPRPVEERGAEELVRQLSFSTCSELAKKHRLTLEQARQALEEFLALDKNKDGRLSFDEFEQAIRDRCEIPAGHAVPQHLLKLNWNKADKDGNAEICFEEFLLWSTEHAFTEELVVLDPKERYLRELARNHGFTLDEVDRCHKTFSESDSNRNGFIEEVEFRHCVASLWKCELEDISATRLRQFWLEADKARLGKLSFEVFLVWYMTIGVR
ncbi:CPK8 [Symbiodinium natans]|uniref:CPK8 protein n=1 Tax=Symbiodinium natans TaxID=878477 RepID=A0A812N3T0_9DINO|nr:CPK8 [Symbiodinium natans]